MNRVSSLVFATATTALTGAAVVMAAGGTIFGLDKITPSGGQPQQAANSASAPLVRASFQQEQPVETAVAVAETEVPFAAGGWAQGATGGESEAIAPETPAAPPPTGFAERSTPPPASTPVPSTPTSAPAAKVATPAPASTPELSEPPSFAIPPNEPTSSAKSAAPVAPTTPTTPPAAAQAPASPTSPPAPSATAAPKWHEDDDDEDHDEDEHEEEDDD